MKKSYTTLHTLSLYIIKHLSQTRGASARHCTLYQPGSVHRNNPYHLTHQCPPQSVVSKSPGYALAPPTSGPPQEAYHAACAAPLWTTAKKQPGGGIELLLVLNRSRVSSRAGFCMPSPC